MAISAVLLLFVGHGGATDHQELGAHQAYTLGAAVGGELRFLGEIDVGAQSDPMAVQRHRLGSSQRLQLLVLQSLQRPPLAVGLYLTGRGVDDEHPRGAIENHVLVAGQQVRRVAKSHHRRKSQRTREDRDV